MKDTKRFTDPDNKAKKLALKQDPVVPEFASYVMPVIAQPYPKLKLLEDNEKASKEQDHRNPS